MQKPDITIAGPLDSEVLVALFNRMFTPHRDADFFDRRLRGRQNVLRLIATVDGHPVGFSVSMEQKPRTWYSWLIGVLPDYRSLGIGAQLMDAEHEWAREHGYQCVRLECYNQHRPVLHLAIGRGFNIAGIRYDCERSDNLVIFEKELLADPDA